MTSKRGLSYSDDEIRTLLDIVGKILPIGQEEWKAVETQHNIDWAQTGRCFQSLRKKFNSFADARMPTGDAHCPPHVAEAKRILEEIKKEAEIEMHEAEFEEPAEEAIDRDTVSAPTTINEDPAGAATPASTANPDNIAPVIPANNGSAVPVPSETLPGGAQASSSTVPAVSNAAARASRLQRMSTGRIRRGAASSTDDMSIQDFFKFTLLQREEDRKERMEREQICEKERQEEREKRDAEERMFRNLFLGILAQGKNGNTDTNTDTNSEI
jgi:hypothetical protein